MCKCQEPNCINGHYPIGYHEEIDEVEWGPCPRCVVNGVHICEEECNGE